MGFEINGMLWKIEFVRPGSACLTRSDGSVTVGVTDSKRNTISLSKRLRGSFLRRVLAHELCHAFCMSYDVYMPIEEEERLANWISLYGSELVYLLDDLMNTVLKKRAA